MSLLLGMLGVALNVQPVCADVWIYITPAGPVTGTTKILWDGDVHYRFIDDIYIDYGGIVVQRSNIEIYGNGYTLQGSGQTSGFYIENANYVTVRDTVIDNFANGFTIGAASYGDHNEIVNNRITNNRFGIDLYEGNNNIIRGNTIEDNKWGVSVADSSGNLFYHNNFINNEQHTLVIGTPSNMWDNGYPSGGNYWSGHICTGNPSDGSQPYEIKENNVDRYPFQDPNGWLPPSEAVGGIWLPVDKFGLLAPYIGLASTIVVATVATAIYVKRVKRRKEKQ